jgi:hypothetical protein
LGKVSLSAARVDTQIQPGGSEVGHDRERKVSSAREPNPG